MLSTDEFKELIRTPESSTLDFKAEMYDLTAKKGVAAFIKDVICFTNTKRNRASYILIGIKEKKDKTLEFLGLAKSYDDAIFQSQIKEKVFPRPSFLFHTLEHEGKQFGIFEFPITEYSEIPAPTVKMKGLDIGCVYHRNGTTNVEALGTEIEDLRQWLKNRDLMEALKANVKLNRIVDDLEKKLGQSNVEPPLDSATPISFAVVQKLQAERNHGKAIEMLKSIASKSNETLAFIYFQIGRSYQLLRQPDESFENYQKALAIADKTPGIPAMVDMKGTAYLYLGILEEERLNHDNAGRYYIQAEKYSLQSNNKIVVGSALIGRGNILKIHGSMAEAIGLFDKALALFKATNHAYGIATALNQLAIAYAERNENEKSLSYDLELLEVSKANKFHFLVADANLGLGTNYQNMGRLDLAKEHLESALNFYELTEGEKNQSAYAYDNLGLIESKKRNLNSSLGFHKKALNLSEDLKDDRGIANARAHIGNVLCYQGNFVEGLENLNQALVIHQRLGYQPGIGFDYCLIGNSYINRSTLENDLSSRELGVQNLIKAREIFIKIGNKTREKKVTDIIHELGYLVE